MGSGGSVVPAKRVEGKAVDQSPVTDYRAFLATKQLQVVACGVDVDPASLHPALKDFQRASVVWALRKGRAAIFHDTGLGKTLQELVWAQHAAERVLVLAPLAVAKQTVREGEKWGIPVTYARSQADAAPAGVTITNYEMLRHFDASRFGAVVLDESSCLKDFTGKTRTALIETFKHTPMRLAATATPAPNDISEIANHAEFLGVMSRVEMLAHFFVHDDEGWRLKGHAREPFYRWLASWAMAVRKPSDLGYSDEGYDLPPLHIRPVICESGYVPEGQLFATGLKGVGDRARVRKGTLADRVAAAVEIVAAEPDEPWILWCGLNDESAALARALPGAVEVRGSQSVEEKTAGIERFLSGEARVLVTKPSIAGFGLNLQHCARMVFVGLSDSWESYYQSVRRCHRFGQTRPVHACVVLSDLEEPVWHNVIGKEREAVRMSEELVGHVAEFERAEIAAAARDVAPYAEGDAAGDGWRLMLGDSCERLRELPDASADLSVFSPPFSHLYVYSASERDLGNSRDDAEFWTHFGYIIAELRRVVKPGRNVCVHVAQLGTTVASHGVRGLRDFRGDTIRAFQSAGFTYYGEVTVDKDPQAQAIRTHAVELLFTQKNKDSAKSRPALADYLLIFKVPGANAAPIVPEVDNEEWILWARPVWYGVRETVTLNVAEARSEDDERHICPLQLDFIERCVRLWSNRGETVLSPFAGIGSEGYVSIRQGRRFVGVELSPVYFNVARKNLDRAVAEARTPDLFSWAEEQEAEAAS